MSQDTRHSTLRWNGVSDYMTTGAASSQSAVFSATCREIRVVAITAGCHINIAANPTAAATDNNGIFLRDSMDDVTPKVRGMFTDPARLRKSDAGNPDVCNLYPYHELLTDEQTRALLRRAGERFAALMNLETDSEPEADKAAPGGGDTP